jgi:hypothetical protein
MKGGMKWWSTFVTAPAGWDPYSQVNSILTVSPYASVAGRLGRMLSGENNNKESGDPRGAFVASRETRRESLTGIAA